MGASAGQFPIVSNQFWNAFNQGSQGVGSGIDSYNNLISAQFNKAKLPYAAQLAQADIASKMAYYNLMGPQFIAKLAGNKDILANTPDPQQLVNFLVSRGMFAADAFKAIQNMGNGTSNAIPSTNQPSPTPDQITQQINNMKPGQAITKTSDQSINIPIEDTSSRSNFWNRSGQAQGIVKEGEESGKNRADNIQQLGEQYDNLSKLGDKFNTFNGLINNPTFRTLRSLPGFQSTQLKVLKNYGTPEQQELIGTFENSANEILRDTISSFPGQKLRGEVDISKNMKVNDSDPFNVILGKIKSAETYKDLNMQRNKLTSDLMEKNHISQRKAEEIANKQLHSQDIINSINRKLDYSITVRNKKTGAIETIPVSEARRRGVPDV